MRQPERRDSSNRRGTVEGGCNRRGQPYPEPTSATQQDRSSRKGATGGEAAATAGAERAVGGGTMAKRSGWGGRGTLAMAKRLGRQGCDARRGSDAAGEAGAGERLRSEGRKGGKEEEWRW